MCPVSHYTYLRRPKNSFLFILGPSNANRVLEYRHPCLKESHWKGDVFLQGSSGIVRTLNYMKVNEEHSLALWFGNIVVYQSTCKGVVCTNNILGSDIRKYSLYILRASAPNSRRQNISHAQNSNLFCIWVMSKIMKHPESRHIKAICSVLVCFATAWKLGFIFHIPWPFCHTLASLFLTWPI